MRFIYKTINVRDEKGFREAEKLQEDGWRINTNGIFSIQFIKELKDDKNKN